MKKTFNLRSLFVFVLISAVFIAVAGIVKRTCFSPVMDLIVVSPPGANESDHRFGTAIVCGNHRPLVAMIDEVSANTKCDYSNLPNWFKFSKRIHADGEEENGILIVNNEFVFPKEGVLIVFVAKDGVLISRREVPYDHVKHLFRDRFYLRSATKLLDAVNFVWLACRASNGIGILPPVR